MDKCPNQIPIPEIFDAYNKKKVYLVPDWVYAEATKDKAKASDCVGCGLCEEACPQKLEIRKLLKQAAEMFE
jgi:predicted aldo/keto reductase-like oxidoreductase